MDFHLIKEAKISIQVLYLIEGGWYAIALNKCKLSIMRDNGSTNISRSLGIYYLKIKQEIYIGIWRASNLNQGKIKVMVQKDKKVAQYEALFGVSFYLLFLIMFDWVCEIFTIWRGILHCFSINEFGIH